MVQEDDARIAADARHAASGGGSGRESVIPIELRDMKKDEDEDDKEAEPEKKRASGGLQVCSSNMIGAMFLDNVAAPDD